MNKKKSGDPKKDFLGHLLSAFGADKEQIRDHSDYAHFRCKNAEDYFIEDIENEPHPFTKKIKSSIVANFRAAARVTKELSAATTDPYFTAPRLSSHDVTALDVTRFIISNLHHDGEMEKMDAFAANKIDVFIKENPERWERLKKQEGTVDDIKKYRPEL